MRARAEQERTVTAATSSAGSRDRRTAGLDASDRGQLLDPGLRGRLERGFGRGLGSVRVHTGERAAARAAAHGAEAVTWGQDIAFAQGRYRPGTLLGDALITHEVAHTIQQREAGHPAEGGAEAALERDADGAVAGALAALWDLGPVRRPRAAAGLGYQACIRDCGSDERRAQQSLLEQLRDADIPTLGYRLQELDARQLDELAAQAPANTLVAEAVQWERAMRARAWSTLARLAASQPRSFPDVYGPRVVAAIGSGATSIRISTEDEPFATWMCDRLEALARQPVGFRLVVELLATGQTVTLQPTTGESRRTDPAGTAAGAGEWQFRGLDGQPLPPEQQRRGRPVGSVIDINRDQMENVVTLGGRRGHLELIDADATVSVGHELIHALHAARGESLPGNALRGSEPNPVTGDLEEAEELRTIMGMSSLPGLSATLPAADITENMLRREHGLPERVSHTGQLAYERVALRRGETLDQVVARYQRADGSPVSAALQAVIRTIVGQQIRSPMPMDFALFLPSPGYISMHCLHVLGDQELASEADEVVIRR